MVCVYCSHFNLVSEVSSDNYIYFANRGYLHKTKEADETGMIMVMWLGVSLILHICMCPSNLKCLLTATFC